MGGNPIRRAAQPSGFSFLTSEFARSRMYRTGHRGMVAALAWLGSLRVSRLTARSGGEVRWISGFDALRIRQGTKPEGASYAG
jgi:hypothetical protein